MAETPANVEPLSGAEYAWSYLCLFSVHWFGARRFDRVGQSDFDPEDVEAYREQKRAYLRRNFTRSRSVLVASGQGDAQQGRPGGAAAGGQAEREGQEAQEVPAEGGAAGLGDVAVPEAAGAGADGQQEQGSDARAAAETQVVTSKQVLPRFVVVQSILICVLWGVAALQRLSAGESFAGAGGWTAGLDSLSSGSTVLRWAGPNCEDYRAEIWRWLTYQWTHIGVGHLFTNTALLVIFGTPLEGHEGTLRVAALFNLGVVGGALCYFVCEGHRAVVGCSGGAYALIGVHFADMLMNWKERHFRYAILCCLLGFLFLDLVTYGMSQDMAKADFSYSANLGGGIAGLIWGSLLGVNTRVTRREMKLVLLMGVISMVLTVFCVIWLGINDAPLNIWEAAAGENGYCWMKQIYNTNLNATDYLCVRCGTESCISEWSQQDTILDVRYHACDAQGWYYDGR